MCQTHVSVRGLASVPGSLSLALARALLQINPRDRAWSLRKRCSLLEARRLRVQHTFAHL